MRFADMKIRTKLSFVILATGVCTLLLAVGAMVIGEYTRTRSLLQGELLTIAEVVGWNSAAALSFSDSDGAEQILGSLSVKPGVLAAYLYDENDRVFAIYHAEVLRRGSAALDEQLSRLPAHQGAFDFHGRPNVTFTEGGRLHVLAPIVAQHQKIGMIHLVDDQSALHAMLLDFYRITLVILGVAIGVMALLSSRLQRVFTRPLAELVAAMNAVTEHKDYQTRVERRSRDEFGDLVDMFNGMIAEVEVRERQLADHGARLQQTVAERTAELSTRNEQLRLAIRDALEAKEQAEAASRAKSEFLATMSHEIRTPMNGVLGMTELLTVTQLDDRQRHFVDTIQQSGHALLMIINDILDFSKIESGLLEVDEHEFALRDLLEHVADLMAVSAHRKGLELTVDIPGESPSWLRGDSHRLQQVLVNLIGNAIKFTERGGIQLRIVPQEEDAGRFTFLCEVEDTGIGIASDAQKRIFEAFMQADGTTTRRHGGTGLGLAISRRLIELMGGAVGVRSRPGEGSVFWFRLDLPKCDDRRDRDVRQPAGLQGRHLLIVDDNATNLEILRGFAEAWGMTCDTASRRQEVAALLAASTRAPAWDVGLLDLHLGAEDGIDVARCLRDDAALAAIPLVMLSSSPSDRDVARATAAGIGTYLRKPVRKQHLHDLLCRQLALNPGVEETRATPTLASAARLDGHVLVAEDNAVNQEVAQSHLEALGCRVTVVADGEQAVQVTERQAFDVVLMDCHMPLVDGFMATRAIRQREAARGDGRAVPIIALTANVQRDVIDQCRAAGMNGYLSKPFTSEQLATVLGDWIRREAPTAVREGAAPAAAPVAAPTAAPAADAPPVFDPAPLDQLRNLQVPGKNDLVARSLERYLDYYEEKTSALLAALAAHDAEGLRATAHFLKSSSATLGAAAMAALCRELEALAKAGDWAAADALRERAQDVTARTAVAMAAELEAEARVS